MDSCLVCCETAPKQTWIFVSTEIQSSPSERCFYHINLKGTLNTLPVKRVTAGSCSSLRLRNTLIPENLICPYGCTVSCAGGMLMTSADVLHTLSYKLKISPAVRVSSSELNPARDAHHTLWEINRQYWWQQTKGLYRIIESNDNSLNDTRTKINSVLK